MSNKDVIILRLQQWGESDSNVACLLLTGSRAHPGARIDRYSDYDVAVFVHELAAFHSDAWLSHFGPILVCWPARPRQENDHITRLVQFRNGFRIDFQIDHVAELQRLQQLTALPAVYDNGYRILMDRSGLADRLAAPGYRAYVTPAPHEQAFLDVVQAFWWDIIYVAKSLLREELFFARYMLDSVIRHRYLRPMLDWYIGVSHDWQVNPNKQGRWYRNYLDSASWQEVEAIFAGPDLPQNWGALFAMCRLFGRSSRVVARSLAFSYPQQVEDDVLAYLHMLHADNPQNPAITPLSTTVRNTHGDS